MIDYLKVTFSIFISVSIVSILFLLTSLLITRKFKNRFRAFYGVFLGSTRREILLFSTNFLNLIVTSYFLFDIYHFNHFGLYMLIFINILACFFAFNFHIIIMNIVYTFITCLLLLLLGVINSYLSDVVFDKGIFYLKIIFMIIVGIFIIFVTIRKMEVIIRSNKSVRRFT